MHWTWLYDKDAADLTAEEKQTISSIIGLAGAAIGASTGAYADIASGAQIGQNAVDNNYLGNYQQNQKEKELIQCHQNTWCRVKVNSKWLAVDSRQQGMLTLGIAEGIPEGIFDAGYDFGTLINNPIQTYKAIKSLINSGDILGNVSEALKQEYSKRLDKLMYEYEKAGYSGAFNAGREIGKLLTDIGTLAAGGVGVGKGIVKVTDKVVGRLAKKAAGTVKEPINSIKPNKEQLTANNKYKVSNGADNRIEPIDLKNPGAQSRINVQNGDSIEGWEHVIKRHFSGKDNASQFTISESDVKNILNSPAVARIPISKTRTSINNISGQQEILYERVVIFDKNIGIDKFNGNQPTKTMTILTDKHGNLKTAIPGRLK